MTVDEKIPLPVHVSSAYTASHSRMVNLRIVKQPTSPRPQFSSVADWHRMLGRGNPESTGSALLAGPLQQHSWRP